MTEQRYSGRRDGNMRSIQIADAAIDVLAAEGGRGLTHRAVDRHLGWPEGTTSRYYRTRDALMTAIVQRLIDVEVASFAAWQDRAASGPMTLEKIAELLSHAFRDWIAGSTRQLARYELSLEGRRRPAVHEALLSGRRQLNEIVAEALEAAGFPNPTVQATLLVSGVDGLCHDMLLHPEITIDPGEIDGILHRWLEAEQRAPHPVRSGQ